MFNISKLKYIFTEPHLRNRLLAVIIGLVIFRLLSTVPVPGVNITQLANYLEQNQFLGLVNLFSGGGLSNFSIVMLGVGPYITGSIIMQLSTIMSPRLKTMYHDEGDIGRKKFQNISRIITVPIALLQAFGLLLLLSKQGVLLNTDPITMVSACIIVAAGSMLVTWIGDLISEYGIGNGTSMLIFAGIVATLPQNITQALETYDVTQLPMYALFTALTVLIIAGVIFMTESERPVSVVYSKQARSGVTYGGTKTYIPLRLNMAGVMPIIFAMSILLFPQFIANLFINSTGVMQTIAAGINSFLKNPVLYPLAYFVLVVLFSFFYTSITFDGEAMANNLQKNGAFIPGIRPGESTEHYVNQVLTRITLVGGTFLGLIAVIPIIIQSATGNATFAIGGTSILIVVSVVIDIIKKVDAELAVYHN